MGTRMVLSMDKGWSFHLGELEQDMLSTHDEIYNSAKAGHVMGAPQSSYDTRDWEVVNLPYDWTAHQPFDEQTPADWGYKKYGKAWFRKSFLLPEEMKDRDLTIEFEGIATHAVVYFNGSVVYRSFSAYVPFFIHISDRANFGSTPNVLAVFVDADIHEGWWYEGAGIYRHVWLYAKHMIHIAHYGLSVRMEETGDNVWRVNLFTNLINRRNEDAEVRILTTLVDPDQELEVNINNEGVLCEVGEETLVETEFTIEDPKVWDIYDPNIYNVVTKVYLDDELIDSDQTVCGFRTIEIHPDEGFFLNGRPLKLMGTCNHQDCGGVGVAVPDNLLEYRIEKLKNMGSNAYRCAHGMPSRELLDICDKVGMLVIDENRNFETSKEGLHQLATMVRRDRNHPSVIMYSLFNEEPLQSTSIGKRMAMTMRREVLKWDDSRFITAALSGGFMEEDSAADALDICGMNYHPDQYALFHEKFPDKPLLALETTSSFSVRGCYEDNEEKHMLSCYDEHPAEWGSSLRDTWKNILDCPYVSGGFIWTGFDYLGEPTPYTWPSVSSFFGLMDRCGFEKDAFYMAKAIFSKKPVCHVLPHWNHDGHEGEVIRVMSHTNCQEAELFLNHRSLGRKTINLLDQAYWDVPYEPGYIELIGYHGGLKLAHDVRITTGKPERVKIVPWRTKMFNDGRDTIPVNLIAVDEKGREVPDAIFPVEVSVDGGKILGMSNGDPNSHEIFHDDSFTLFHGRCQMIVQANEGAKQMIISAGAANITFGTLLIPLSFRKGIRSVESIRENHLTGWKMTVSLFDEKPNVNMHVDDFDMNTWMDVLVDDKTGAPKIFENQEGKYGLYRLRTRIPNQLNGRPPVLHFNSIWGNCEVYINGQKRGECQHEWPEEFDIELQERDAGVAEIRVLVQGNNFGAGLNASVLFR